MAGIGLVYDNWLGLMVLVTLSSTALVYRILVEERALEAALGQAYRSYAAAHKRLVPFVW
jgi:protein-S-isoprenylcysteine O-methyltransferase Ste14